MVTLKVSFKCLQVSLKLSWRIIFQVIFKLSFKSVWRIIFPLPSTTIIPRPPHFLHLSYRVQQLEVEVDHLHEPSPDLPILTSPLPVPQGPLTLLKLSLSSARRLSLSHAPSGGFARASPCLGLCLLLLILIIVVRPLLFWSQLRSRPSLRRWRSTGPQLSSFG